MFKILFMSTAIVLSAGQFSHAAGVCSGNQIDSKFVRAFNQAIDLYYERKVAGDGLLDTFTPGAQEINLLAFDILGRQLPFPNLTAQAMVAWGHTCTNVRSYEARSCVKSVTKKLLTANFCQ